MAKPMTKKLLCHTATLYRGAVRDSWGKTTVSGAATDLAHVRLEPSEGLTITRDNRQITLRLTMFFDCVNSTPQGLTFRLGDVVQWEGENYTVESVSRRWDESKLHHWELGLA